MQHGEKAPAPKHVRNQSILYSFIKLRKHRRPLEISAGVIELKGLGEGGITEKRAGLEEDNLLWLHCCEGEAIPGLVEHKVRVEQRSLTAQRQCWTETLRAAPSSWQPWEGKSCSEAEETKE